MFHASLLSPVHLDKGILHKSLVFEGEVHIVEEIQLLKNPESIKNLLLSSEVSDYTKMQLQQKKWGIVVEAQWI